MFCVAAFRVLPETRMNAWLIAASVAAFVTFALHTFVGGPQFARPLLAARDLPRIPKLTMYFCWHMVTVLLLGMAIALAYGAFVPNPALTIAMIALSLAFTVLSLGLVFGFRVSALHLPQWVLFLVITLLATAGLV
jgi:hypothetical protein